jgi:CheY-like chemotaxis protein
LADRLLFRGVSDPLVYSSDSRPIVLIVEHDATKLKLARRVLESDGFAVSEATDAVSTFEALKTCYPAMIVLDVQLPGMDGWALARRLKSNFATAAIPLIIVTAFGTEADRQYAHATGCAAFVEKPISSTDLPEIIRRHLSSDSK